MLADVIVPDIFHPYVIERTAAKTELIQAGIIVRMPELDLSMQGGGKIIDMPFWKDLTGDDEIVTSGGTASVGKITTSLDKARRLLRQKGWGAEDIAGILAGSDPMKAIGELVSDYWARRFQAMTISTLKGIFSSTLMAASNVLSIAQTSGAATDANKLNGATVVAGMQLMGDSKNKLKAIAMHSAVEAALVINDDIDFIQDSSGALVMKQYRGLRVIVDDSMPVRTLDSKLAYTTYLFGEGAIGYGENTAPKPIPGGIGNWYQALARVELQGLSIMMSRRDLVLHPRGVAFIDAAVAAETPTNLELENGANWNRVYEQKNVRLVKIEHNI